MKKIHFILWLSFIFICVTFFSACIKEHVTGVTLNNNELILSPGEEEVLVATVFPADATNKKVIWKSNNPDVATVNRDGVVKAIKYGEAIITVTTKDGNYTETCKVIVDYRSKWAGKWDFQINCCYPIEIELNEWPYSYYKWIHVYTNYSGWIALFSHPQKIIVKWGADNYFRRSELPGLILDSFYFKRINELTVDLNGNLSYPEYGGHGHTNFWGGKVCNDTIVFEISSGGLGAYISCEVIGIKKHFLL